VTEGKSVLDMLEEQGEEQARIKVSQAIARTGAADPEGVVECLSGFDAAKELAQNQEAFLNTVKRIRSNMELTGGERLELGRQAAAEAQQRHQELTAELERQRAARTKELDKTLLGGSDTLALSALADLDQDQLALRLDVARAAGDLPLLRAARVIASAKGFDSLVEKSVGFDPEPEVSAAYTERQKLQSAGAIDALSGAYLPPPIKPQQLQPDTVEVQRWENAKASAERSATRIMEGRPRLTDVDFSPRGTHQVGSRRY
jgi:hypothetical protein